MNRKMKGKTAQVHPVSRTHLLTRHTDVTTSTAINVTTSHRNVTASTREVVTATGHETPSDNTATTSNNNGTMPDRNRTMKEVERIAGNAARSNRNSKVTTLKRNSKMTTLNRNSNATTSNRNSNANRNSNITTGTPDATMPNRNSNVTTVTSNTTTSSNSSNTTTCTQQATVRDLTLQVMWVWEKAYRFNGLFLDWPSLCRSPHPHHHHRYKTSLRAGRTCKAMSSVHSVVLFLLSCLNCLRYVPRWLDVFRSGLTQETSLILLFTFIFSSGVWYYATHMYRMARDFPSLAEGLATVLHALHAPPAVTRAWLRVWLVACVSLSLMTLAVSVTPLYVQVLSGGQESSGEDLSTTRLFPAQPNTTLYTVAALLYAYVCFYMYVGFFTLMAFTIFFCYVLGQAFGEITRRLQERVKRCSPRPFWDPEMDATRSLQSDFPCKPSDAHKQGEGQSSMTPPRVDVSQSDVILSHDVTNNDVLSDVLSDDVTNNDVSKAGGPRWRESTLHAVKGLLDVSQHRDLDLDLEIIHLQQSSSAHRDADHNTPYPADRNTPYPADRDTTHPASLDTAYPASTSNAAQRLSNPQTGHLTAGVTVPADSGAIAGQDDGICKAQPSDTESQHLCCCCVFSTRRGQEPERHAKKIDPGENHHYGAGDFDEASAQTEGEERSLDLHQATHESRQQNTRRAPKTTPGPIASTDSPKRRMSDFEKAFDCEIEFLRWIHMQLKELVELGDGLVGSVAFAVYWEGTLMACFALYSLMTGAFPRSEYFTLFVCLAAVVLQIVCCTSAGAWLNEKAHEPEMSLLQLNVCSLTDQEFRSLSVFLAQVQQRHIGITAFRLFPITRATYLTVVGTIITYAVLVLQFNTGCPSSDVTAVSNVTSA